MDALEKAKETSIKEKHVRKLKENANSADLINIDLSFAVALNHALCFESNGMLQ